MVRPKKYLGQHFLTDKKLAERITNLLVAADAETILEIGPGEGILTQYLENRKDNKLVIVEIDPESVEFIREHYPALKDSVLEMDFLRMDIESLGDKFAVIGNFPYNISSQIFFKFLEYPDRITEIVCMLQKEVALRLASGPGSKQYGILSVLLQTWFNINVEFHVKPGAFFPSPEVNSTVIRLTRNRRKVLSCDEGNYKKIVKTAFNQRRKMLRNSLKSILLNLNEEIPYLSYRPEQLSVEQFIELCMAIENSNLKI